MENKRHLYSLFLRTVNGEYTQLKEQTASYRTESEGDTLFLFFEKSNGAVDWLNNLDFPAKPYREMKDLWFVHRGFLRVFKVIEPHIAPLILDESVKKIVVSGYSHGAALALLCHEYCVFHRPDLAEEIAGVGFGCPRVVWGPLGKPLKARFERFTVVRNGKDIVTHVPPWIFGFHHVGKMIRIGEDADYGPIDAHRPENYLSELTKYKE